MNSRLFIILGFSLLSPAACWAGDEVVTKFPDRIADLAVGGEGRFIVIRVAGDDTLRIYDTAARKVVQVFQLPSTEVVFAAGDDTVLVYIKDTKEFQVWSLTSMKRVKTAPSPHEAPVRQLVMGHARADRAFVVCATDASGEAGRGPIAYFVLDVATLTPDRKVKAFNGVLGDEYSVTAPLRGDRYLTRIVYWRSGVSPNGVNLILLTGRGFEFQYSHDSEGYVVAGDDGNVYTASGRVYGSEPVPSQRIRSELPTRGRIKDQRLFPGLGGTFVLGVEADGSASVYQSGRTTALCAAGKFSDALPTKVVDSSPGAQRRTMVEFDAPRGAITRDKHIVFAPSLGYVLYLPEGEDRLVQRPFDLQDLLAGSGRDYFLVTSSPPTYVKAGVAWKYQITTLSKAGTVNYTLGNGPQGMTLSAEGLMMWKVPTGIEGRAPVTVLAKDSSGREARHSFVIEFD